MIAKCISAAAAAAAATAGAFFGVEWLAKDKPWEIAAQIAGGKSGERGKL